MTLHVENGVRLLTGRTEFGHPAQFPYPVVSQWIIDDTQLHPTAIDYRFVELIGKVYGRGFGSRDRAVQEGTNVYLGTRGSDQSNLSPSEGTGQARKCQYYREYYSQPTLRAEIQKQLNVLLERAKKFSSQIDYMMDQFLTPPAPVALWTQGHTNFGFQNTGHVDSADRFATVDENTIMVGARTECAYIRSPYTQVFMAYLEEVAATIGLGYSTTYAYQHVFHPSANKDSMVGIQFF
jgi:hypothetical protein